MRQIVTRKEAHQSGAKKYYTGEPCKREHTCERFVANGACVMCQNWGSPKRHMKGPRGNNVGWPSVGLIFNTPDVLPEEIEAAFRYIEACGWHDAALQAVRKDPALLAKYVAPLTPSEEGRMHVALERQRRVLAAIKGEDK